MRGDGPAPAPRRWTSLHVFYDGDLDVVVTDLVAAVRTRLDAEGASAGTFFLRYWEGGPHLRIRVLPRAAREDDVRAIVEHEAATFLVRCPAPALLTQEEYARYAPGLAAAEGMVDYERTRRPNNSFAHVPYRPETHRYGAGASLHAAEDHFVTCSDTVLRLLAAGATANQRTTAAVAVLALSRWLCPSATPPAAPGGTPSSAVTERYHRQRHVLGELVGRMRLLAQAPPAGPTGTLGTWAGAIATLAARIEDPALRWRVVDTCAHLTCNRLGVAVPGERELRHLVDRAFADLTTQGRPA
ncbi:lantibiotic dehydratase C-terminal domain-containing protein [Micromonospora sp. LOL_025]|uniref:lantibiotic dehydratase C-terminal domain-containing protein n=1 Tax=Micromonospora sp. LOL_025 TaxID=3345413 RepID=UPI003A88D6C3